MGVVGVAVLQESSLNSASMGFYREMFGNLFDPKIRIPAEDTLSLSLSEEIPVINSHIYPDTIILNISSDKARIFSGGHFSLCFSNDSRSLAEPGYRFHKKSRCFSGCCVVS